MRRPTLCVSLVVRVGGVLFLAFVAILVTHTPSPFSRRAVGGGEPCRRFNRESHPAPRCPRGASGPPHDRHAAARRVAWHVRHGSDPHGRRPRNRHPDAGSLQLRASVPDQRLAGRGRGWMADRRRSPRGGSCLPKNREARRGGMTTLGAERRRKTAVRGSVLVLALVFFLLPLAWTILASLGVLPDNNTHPPSWRGPITFDHFSEVGVAEPGFWEELATSTVSAAFATTLAIASAFLAAYCLARTSFHGRRLVTQGFLVLASLPAMAYVIPVSDVMRRVHLADTLVGVVLAEAAVTAPLAAYVLYGAIAQLSPEWEEAAVLDGAGLFRVMGQVVLPLVGPSLAATAIVLFVIDWNLLLVPLVLTSGDVKTVPVAMSDFFTFERELDWPTAAAALVASLVPIALLVAASHRLVERFRLEQGARDIG